MKLRTQLILAFLLLAVVPLASISLYSYNASQRALRQAAQAESERLAADLGSRMQDVSDDLSRRIQRLGSLPFRTLMAQRRRDRHEEADALVHQMMNQMGDTASFLKSLEFTPAPPPPPDASAQGLRSKPVVPREPPPPEGVVIDVAAVAGDSAEVKTSLEEGRMMLHIQVPMPPSSAALSALSGAAEAQVSAVKKQAELAQKLNTQVEAIRRTALNQSGKVLETQRQLQFSLGRRFNAEVRSGDEVVGNLRAEVSTQRILRHVLSRTQRIEGEIPFAVDPEGKIHAADPADVPKVEALPLPPSIKAAVHPEKIDPSQNWVIVTRKDEHSGVTFGIARPIGDRLGELRRTTARNLGYGLALVGIALIGIVPLSGRMTHKLTVLSKGVERLAHGDLQARVEIHSGDEFGQLAKAFNRMAQDLGEHEKQVVEQERLRKELEMCRTIQLDLLPRQPLRTGLVEVKGISIPAREVGGDFFNYFTLPNGDVAVLVGDVSGKGLPAALLMANLQATIQARLPLALNLAKLAEQLDNEIDVNTPKMYLTLFIAILETQSRSMRYVNAGHNPQFLLRLDGQVERLESTGRPLGLLPGGTYAEKQISLDRGDALFFYTDGLVEAENGAGEEFGMSRLETLVVGEREKGAEEGLLAAVEGAVREYRGSVQAADDATLLLVKIGPSVPA